MKGHGLRGTLVEGIGRKHKVSRIAEGEIPKGPIKGSKAEWSSSAYEEKAEGSPSKVVSKGGERTYPVLGITATPTDLVNRNAARAGHLSEERAGR